ncbi:MAG: type IV toxin-antitoxin system AbiEi family antitoxin domain-containing protein, partial [Porticoccaceae bacterium]
MPILPSLQNSINKIGTQADPLHAGPFEKRSGAPRVSTPERALLEVLSEVGVRQPLQEA